MDSILAGVVSEFDATRVTSWLQNAYLMYYQVSHSDWGFPIVACIALVSSLWLVLHYVPSITTGVKLYLHTCWLGKRFRSLKGRYDMRKRLRNDENRWIADRLVEVLTEGRLLGNISARTSYAMQDKVGRLFGISDLIRKRHPMSRQRELKSRLKSKHANKLVDLAQVRKERSTPKPTLKDRIAAAGNRKSVA